MKNLNSRIQTALFCIIVVLLGMTSIGYINLGIIKVTTVHIPVIIASILFGYRAGALCGLIFGLTSFINNTFISPSITSFLFTPFYENAFGKGNFLSLVICFLPRILTGVTPYLVYNSLMKKVKSKSLRVSLASATGALTNTILVMGMVYIFFGTSYANALEIDFVELPKLILTVISTNGLAEIISSVVISLSVCNVLMKIRS